MWQLRVARREADEQLAEAKAALARAAADAERVAVREVRRQCAEEYQEQLRAVQQAAEDQRWAELAVARRRSVAEIDTALHEARQEMEAEHSAALARSRGEWEAARAAQDQQASKEGALRLAAAVSAAEARVRQEADSAQLEALAAQAAAHQEAMRAAVSDAYDPRTLHVTDLEQPDCHADSHMPHPRTPYHACRCLTCCPRAARSACAN